jgi:hypothetical protein
MLDMVGRPRSRCAVAHLLIERHDNKRRCLGRSPWSARRRSRRFAVEPVASLGEASGALVNPDAGCFSRDPSAQIDPPGDLHADAPYRGGLVATLIERACRRRLSKGARDAGEFPDQR